MKIAAHFRHLPAGMRCFLCALGAANALGLAIIAAPPVLGAQPDDAAAMAARAETAYSRGDVVEALRWFRRAAEVGHARSQARLAFVLDKAGEYEEAVAWYRKAAEQGDVEGQHGLAMKYASGEGITPAPEQMLHWLKQAARQDHVQSILALARTLERGAAGIPADPAGSLPYWRRAAELGDHGAMLQLADAHRKGELGLAIDLEEARRWEARFTEATRNPKPATR